MENSKKAKPSNKKDLLVSVGYSENTALTKPQEIIEQKGTKEELNALGFTEDNANLVVGTILMNSGEAAKDRLKAAELVYKVKGSFVADQNEKKATSIVNIFNDANVLIATQAYEASLKQIITNESTQPVQEAAAVEADN